MSSYIPVIGLEIHAELLTKSKVFCTCSAEFGGSQNSRCCPVCTGMPGTLPVINQTAVEYAVKAGMALGCDISKFSVFDRKNYFYPDLPKAYQISQLYYPLCLEGKVAIDTPDGQKYIRINHIHLEEDAGKLVHDDFNAVSLADYNRCGIPLVEIVTEPDISSAEEAKAFIEKVMLLLQYAGVSDCKMEEGSLRCDVNVSIMRPGDKELGTRAEIKNMNSLKSITRAINYEIKRQSRLLDAGKKVVQETRRFNENKGETSSMRSKENAHDYRYFPEPDLPPVVFSAEELERLRASLPMLPDEKRALFQQKYGLPRKAAELLTDEKWLADYFMRAAADARNPAALANLLLGEVFAQLTLRETPGTERDESSLPIPPRRLAALSNLLDEGRVNSSTGKKILAALFDEDVEPETYAQEHGLFLVTDETVLRQAAEQALRDNPSMVEGYLRGKLTVEKALMGKAMALTRGRADPERLSQLVHEALAALAAQKE